MTEFQSLFLQYESELRLGSFVVLLLLMLFLERCWPRRRAMHTPARRLNNLLLQGINLVILRVCVPLATFQAALIAAKYQYGVFNLLALPLSVNILLTIIAFDLLIYLQHVAFHKFKPLWQIHRVHHTDTEFDVTTGIRFHPLEIVLSMIYKLIAVFLLGPAAVAIVLYEILLNAAALFTHGNLRINGQVDGILRKVLVTPDMHRVHHSIIRRETDSNYGNLFSFWDKIFRTYNRQPEHGHDGMVIGLEGFQAPSASRLLMMLKTPFLSGR